MGFYLNGTKPYELYKSEFSSINPKCSHTIERTYF